MNDPQLSPVFCLNQCGLIGMENSLKKVIAQVEEEPNTVNHWKSRSSGWTQTISEAQSRNDIFNKALVNALKISPNDKVLDLAAGTGEPSISIANSIQKYKKASIVATDLTIEMLKIAKRADLLEFSNIKFTFHKWKLYRLAAIVLIRQFAEWGLCFQKIKSHVPKRHTVSLK